MGLGLGQVYFHHFSVPLKLSHLSKKNGRGEVGQRRWRGPLAHGFSLITHDGKPADIGLLLLTPQSLGVAFNSTLIALLISLVLMFLLHQLQLQQERLVMDTKNYLDRHLIQRLQVSS